MDPTAVLYPLNAVEVDIHINRKEFVIGRAKNASYDIKDVLISRNHCVLKYNGLWTIRDMSSAGTWLNNHKLKGNEDMPLQDSDLIELGLSKKYVYIFCTGGQLCPKSCYKRTKESKSGLDAELAQKRRVFDYEASLQKDGLERSIREKQQDRQKLEQQQRLLRHNFNQQLQILEERNRKLHIDLEKKGSANGSNLSREREELEKQFRNEKQNLEKRHLTETSDLASRISAFEAAEADLKSQNKALLERLECEKQQFELRLEEERKSLQAKFAEQLAEQQKLAAEKAEVEQALMLRIQDLEKTAHKEEKQLQERLSNEKLQFEKRLEELQKALEEKERQEKEREKQLMDRDNELKAQEEQRERERKEREERMEAEFLAKKKELEDLEKERQLELNRHKEEVTKELQDREAELQRKAQEHEREIEEQKMKEQERLKKELELREQEMRQQLESAASKLQQEKISLEMSIRAELSKKEGENAEILNKLSSELDQVKRDLDTTSTKRILLEKELEEASRAKEAASQSELQARKDVIENFGELVESELQCSICNELFVTATTLNCNHTFCYICISQWLEKKKDCPICRTKYTQLSKSLVLDNFIDKMVENLSQDLKKRRKEIVDERKATNPSKKIKLAVANNENNPRPLQIVNGNVIGGARIVVRQVSSAPPGAPVIRVTTSAAGALDRGYQLLTVPSTSQGNQQPLQPQQPQLAVLTSLQQRLQQLQPELQALAHQSSLVQNQTMNQTSQIRPGIRTRGGAAPRPVANAGARGGSRAPMNVPRAAAPPVLVRPVGSVAPRNVPPLAPNNTYRGPRARLPTSNATTSNHYARS